ncbi:flagellar brake protein [Paenibacillus enshidis]|uniref:Flagellar brake protein n=1 Tax=Paenibacillus enshidis TaxID=1458439 RepID=A0ABV5AS46_9BACL
MLPKITDMLFFQLAASDDKTDTFDYRARIMDMKEDNYLVEIPINVDTGKMKMLHLGDELSVVFVNENGLRHYFNSHVTGFEKDRVQLIHIRKPLEHEITKVQRRSYLRVPASLEIAVQSQEHAIHFITHTIDVGGGGVSFNARPEAVLQSGWSLKCWLLVPYKNGTREHVRFEAEIVRIVVQENGTSQVMAAYKKIPDLERQKVIRYCFEQQLEHRH